MGTYSQHLVIQSVANPLSTTRLEVPQNQRSMYNMVSDNYNRRKVQNIKSYPSTNKYAALALACPEDIIPDTHDNKPTHLTPSQATNSDISLS